MSELSSLSVAQQRALLNSKQVSSRELVDGALARIEQVQPDLNCFVEVWADEARERAQSVDFSQGGLAGIPVAIKDTSSWLGHKSTSGSRIFEHNVALHTDAVVQKLLDAGAIIVGSTNTPEFAHAGITAARTISSASITSATMPTGKSRTNCRHAARRMARISSPP
jgi:aspartyl-tRNA(Asn)/glutamyl-tRNA(Gln) amidotransferase subunit A